APIISLLTPTNGASAIGNLLLSGTASDNIALQKVEFRLDGGAWVTANKTSSWSYNLNSSNFLNSPHLLSARATDTSKNATTTNINVRFVNIPGNYVQRVSGGNTNTVLDCSNNTWSKDVPYSLGSFGYSGGTSGYVANAISGVCSPAQSLYQRE